MSRLSRRGAVIAVSAVLALSSAVPAALASREGDDFEPEPGGGLGLPELGLPNLGLPNLGLPNLGLPNVGLPNVGLPELGQLPLPELGGVILPELPPLTGILLPLPLPLPLPGLPGTPGVGVLIAALLTLSVSGSISVL